METGENIYSRWIVVCAIKWKKIKKKIKGKEKKKFEKQWLGNFYFLNFISLCPIFVNTNAELFWRSKIKKKNFITLPL